MDAFKESVEWLDNGPTGSGSQDATTRLFPLDGRFNIYEMAPCYWFRLGADFWGCPDEPLCEHPVETDGWQNNCGTRTESGVSMSDMHCARTFRPACPRNPQPVSFQGHAFSGRAAFVGTVGWRGECLGVFNWICMGLDRFGRGCLDVSEVRRWSPARMDWRDAALVEPPRHLYARPEIEHTLKVAVLDYVTANAGGLHVENLDRPNSDDLGKIDWWEKTWNLEPPLLECDELPVVAGLPGASYRGSDDPVQAELCLSSVSAWMSLHFRQENVSSPGDPRRRPPPPAVTWSAAVTIGLDIECVVRANGVCGTPPRQNGQPLEFKSGEDWYRPPYSVEWRGEATPRSDPPWFNMTGIVNEVGGLGNPNMSNIAICRKLRVGMGAQTIHARSVTKGGGDVELYGGRVAIVRIGD